MPSTFIFGGAGRTGRHLAQILLHETQPPHTVYALTRSDASAASLTSLGATPIIQSLTDSSASDLATIIRNCAPDFVVWAAGADGKDPDSTDAVDRLGAIKSMDAAAEAGVGRYIIVSAMDLRDRAGKPVPAWYGEADVKMSNQVWGAVEPFMQAKFDADRELVVGNGKRGLRYTIVRPGGLMPQDGTGKVSAGKIPIGMISREDVARVVARCMLDEETVGLAFDVCWGDSSVDEAVRYVAEHKVDCFEGFY